MNNDGKDTGKTYPNIYSQGSELKTAEGVDYIIRYDRNIKGEITGEYRDNNLDGKYDYYEKFTLNANGGVIQKERDNTNDGQFDSKVTYTLYASGGYRNSNGDVTGVDVATYYNLIKQEDGSTREVVTGIEYNYYEDDRWVGSSIDRLGDGSINYGTYHILDEKGRVSQSYFNNDGKGGSKEGADRVETYTRDNNGSVLRTEVDNGNDGSIDVVRKYKYDELGRSIQREVDSDNDGRFETRNEYTYNEFGQEVTAKTYSYNEKTGSMELTNQTERTFNSDGRTETVIYDDHTVKYTYDEYGRTLTDKAEAFDRHWKYSYNQDGTVSSRTSYSLKTGELQEVTRYTEYSPYTKQALAGEIYDSQDKLTNSFRYYLNDQGNIEATLVDKANNGKGWDRYIFGDIGAVSVLNRSEDMTKWSEEKLAELGNSLSEIKMAQGSAINLTLNAEVAAKISNRLVIFGAEDKNDTLNLSGFVKADNSGYGDMTLYTAKVGDENLNLYVQNYVDVVLG
ncbi:hypothetical protein [Mannheimia indoligenes]|uniref:hypothetical protein n=1 Tax=Mannheimia indoligenes TaxID=3103145 RepID=UPI002FE597A6